MNPLAAYARWLHTGVPAGRVEPLPEVLEAGRTTRPGLRIAGDLLGTPLLKLAVQSGAAAARAFADELRGDEDTSFPFDLAVVGAGPAGLSAAAEASRLGLRVAIFDSREPLSTIADFPAKKPILLYPTDLVVESPLTLAGESREALLAHLDAERVRLGLEVGVARLVRVDDCDGGFSLVGPDGEFARARRVLIAVGRSGERRRLGVPGEDHGNVRHRLIDPATYARRRVVVVGGGDSAVEAALAIGAAGGRPVLVHRGSDLARAKAENRDALVERGVEVRLGAAVGRIEEGAVELRGGDRIACDDVLVLVGREPPHALLAALRVPLRGVLDTRLRALTAFTLAVAAFVYVWKSGGDLTHLFERRGYFPFGLGDRFDGGSAFARVLAVTLEEPGFHYSTLYSLAVLGFGLRRVARTPTPYVRRQTLVLGLVQWLPLYVLPYFLLPYLGRLGAFDDGVGRSFADAFFPSVTYGHGREYWRAFGFVLAFPLFIWNVFTSKPSVPWLLVSVVQTFVLIPLLVRKFGKGAYCGFLCSCGALAETVGDGLRTRMPHGPFWNRLNMLGQGVLFAVFALALLRAAAWTFPHARAFGLPLERLFGTLLYDATLFGVRVDYYHLVDVGLAGILGVGLYVGFSGRTWCRFACPLAALMHVYARAFSRFRIVTDAKRCIACGECTAVCHQGIDVAAYAVRGLPMTDAQCVRCSACVATCPTNALRFGRLEGDVVVLDALPASLVQLREDGRRALRVVS